MKVRIVFDVSEYGYILIQTASSDLEPDRYFPPPPNEKTKRYQVEVDVPAPYQIEKINAPIVVEEISK